MTKRIVAVSFIFVCSAIAWTILGSALLVRTYTTGDTLGGQVQSIWGSPQIQASPTATYTLTTEKNVESTEKGITIHRLEEKHSEVQLPLDSSTINVDLGIDYREKGLLWYSTYRAGFSGTYVFRNVTTKAQNVTFGFPLPAKQAIYDDVVMMADDKSLPLTTANGVLSGSASVAAGATVALRVGYRSQGLDTWQYKLGDEVAEVKNFTLKIRTNFGGFDFPENTLDRKS